MKWKYNQECAARCQIFRTLKKKCQKFKFPLSMLGSNDVLTVLAVFEEFYRNCLLK